MGKPKKEEVAVVEPRIDENEEVSINLDENNQVVKPEVKKVEEPKYVTADMLAETQRKSNAAFFAEQRKVQQMLERLEAGLKPKEVVRETPEDEWDVKVQKNWKGTVEELADARAEAKYKQLREREISEQKAIDEQARTSQLLENNKQTVMQRHPELNDSTSEKAAVFQSVISRNPDYLSNPFGPVLAMRDMEEELRGQGKMIDSATTKIVESEVQRRARTAATSVPHGNGNSTTNKVVLTKDEREYCDNHKIKYETFASMKNRPLNQGVEV